MPRPTKTINSLQPLKEKIERDEANQKDRELKQELSIKRQNARDERFKTLLPTKPVIPKIKTKTGLSERTKEILSDNNYPIIRKRDIEKEIYSVSLLEKESLIEREEEAAIEQAVQRNNKKPAEKKERASRITLSDLPEGVREAAKKKVACSTIRSTWSIRLLRKRGVTGQITLNEGLNKIECPSVNAAIKNSEIISEHSAPRLSKKDVISRRAVPKGHSGHKAGKPKDCTFNQKQSDAWEERNAQARGGVEGDVAWGVALLRKQLLRECQNMTA